MPKKLLAVGRKARSYDLTFPRTDVMYVDDEGFAVTVAASFNPDGIVVAGDLVAVSVVRRLRETSPRAGIVAVAPLSERAAHGIVDAGANFCAASWLAVVAQDLVHRAMEMQCPPSATEPAPTEPAPSAPTPPSTIH